MIGNIIVGIIVFTALFFTVRHIYKTVSGKSSCCCSNGKSSGCSGCSVKK